MSNPQDFHHDKSYNLKRLAILTPNGKRIDITNLLVELNIFEDLYSTSVVGDITVSDSIDLIARLPITGFEYLIITFGKPNVDTEFTKVFRVYKVDEIGINYGNQTNQTYTIRFCSEEEILSLFLVVSKSYKGKVISDIISDILNNILKIDSGSIEQIETTKNKHDFIIPAFPPFEAIKYVTSRTVPTHMFYESLVGYNFRSLESLFKQDTKFKYRFVPQNISTEKNQDTRYGMNNVIKYEFMNMFDIINAVTNGMFASSLRTIDLVRQRNSTINYDYKKEFAKLSHIEQSNPQSFMSEAKDRFGKMINEYPASLFRFYPTNKDHNTLNNIVSKQPNINQTLVEQWMIQHISVMEQLNYFKLKLVLAGDTTLNIGNMIEFGVPLLATKIPGETNLNPYFSGRFMVTAIRHKINPYSYEMIVEAVKDSFSQNKEDSNENSSKLATRK